MAVRVSGRFAKTRPAWPDWWVEGGDSMAVERCRILWIEVLRTCLIESLERTQSELDGGSKRLTGADVESQWWWSAGMREVADLAGYDGAAVQSRLMRQVDQHGAGAVAMALRIGREEARIRGCRGPVPARVKS